MSDDTANEITFGDERYEITSAQWDRNGTETRYRFVIPPRMSGLYRINGAQAVHIESGTVIEPSVTESVTPPWTGVDQ